MNDIDISRLAIDLVDADYIATEGDLDPNREAQVVIDLFAALRAYEGRLDIAWCGAALAQLFLEHHWLQSFDLELWTESVMGDEGERFISHYAHFRQCNAVPGTSLHEDVQDSDGTFNPDLAGELLFASHEDNEFDFCQPFIPTGSEGRCTLTLDRDVLAPLLAGPAVSGLAVARLLWPDHESLRPLASHFTTSATQAASADTSA